MKEYCVSVPIAGYAVIVVEAEDEDGAIEKALDEVSLSNIESWEALEHICEGNCFNGPLNDAEAEEQ
jgi:hypothetical protein